MGVTAKSSISNIIISYAEIAIKGSLIARGALSPSHSEWLGLQQVLELAALALLAAALFLLYLRHSACFDVFILQYI